VARVPRAARAGGSRRLAGLLSQYGGAIEYDLQTICGVDLADLWRQRRWRKLLSLIDQLPRASRFMEALAADEDLARLYLEHADDDEPPPGERWSDWTPERDGLARVEDAIQLLTRTVAAVGGAKNSSPFKPAARPRSAMDDVRDVDRRGRHLSLVQRLTPGG